MIYSYHPGYFKHFKRIADRYPNDLFSKKITEFKFYHKNNNPLYWMGRFMTNSVPVDRTNKFNLLNMEDCPIPKIDNFFNKTYDEVCYSSALEYWKYYNDITVLWSGGLDSTCVAIAFLQTRPLDKKLSFVGSVESIEEYPKFYEDHKSLITIDTPTQFWNRFKVRSTDTRYVTGDIGDQIFGGCINEFGDRKNENWQNFIDWKDVFRQSYMLSEELRREWTSKEKQRFLDKMEQFNLQAPFPIVTLFDFVWWLTFSTRVNGAGNNITVLTTEMTGIKKAAIDTYSPFYLNNDFQQWSMLNHQAKYPGGVETYKQPIKNFIIRYNNDTDFMMNKKKEKSTPRLLGNDNWFQDWVRNMDTNYLIMSDGTMYNKENDVPFDLIKTLLKI